MPRLAPAVASSNSRPKKHKTPTVRLLSSASGGVRRRASRSSAACRRRQEQRRRSENPQHAHLIRSLRQREALGSRKVQLVPRKSHCELPSARALSQLWLDSLPVVNLFCARAAYERRYHLSLTFRQSWLRWAVNLGSFQTTRGRARTDSSQPFTKNLLAAAVFAEDDGCRNGEKRNYEGQGGCRQYSCTLLPFPPRDGRDHPRCCTAVSSLLPAVSRLRRISRT